jgi:hypothetical protein
LQGADEAEGGIARYVLKFQVSSSRIKNLQELAGQPESQVQKMGVGVAISGERLAGHTIEPQKVNLCLRQDPVKKPMKLEYQKRCEAHRALTSWHDSTFFLSAVYSPEKRGDVHLMTKAIAKWQNTRLHPEIVRALCRQPQLRI